MGEGRTAQVDVDGADEFQTDDELIGSAHSVNFIGILDRISQFVNFHSDVRTKCLA